MGSILYPDSGGRLEDASVLRNAVYFSTAERAYSARLILKQSLGVDSRTLSFLVIRAFEEFMRSTADLFGWLFVLREWQPGNADFSLLLLLDRIAVGRKGYKEDEAVSILSNIDAEGFRELCHIPKEEELINFGMSRELVENIKHSMSVKLESWLKIANRRAKQNRGWVRMFNKFKHHILAFPVHEKDKHEVWLPTSLRLEKARNRVLMGQGWIEVSTNEVRRFASDALVTQAVLHDTLAVILITRYGEKYDLPQWVVKAYQMA